MVSIEAAAAEFINSSILSMSDAEAQLNLSLIISRILALSAALSSSCWAFSEGFAFLFRLGFELAGVEKHRKRIGRLIK
jgi:hypothetical protein